MFEFKRLEFKIMEDGMDKTTYDEATHRALHLFVVLARCCNSVSDQARQDIARYDLSGSEFAVLELLHHKGPTPLGPSPSRCC